EVCLHRVPSYAFSGCDVPVDRSERVTAQKYAPQQVAEELRRGLEFVRRDLQEPRRRVVADDLLPLRRLLVEMHWQRRDCRGYAIDAPVDRRQPHRLLG